MNSRLSVIGLAALLALAFVPMVNASWVSHWWDEIEDEAEDAWDHVEDCCHVHYDDHYYSHSRSYYVRPVYYQPVYYQPVYYVPTPVYYYNYYSPYPNYIVYP